MRGYAAQFLAILTYLRLIFNSVKGKYQLFLFNLFSQTHLTNWHQLLYLFTSTSKELRYAYNDRNPHSHPDNGKRS